MAKCMHPKCNTGLPGAWEPIILLWPARPGGHMFEPASVNIKGVVVCEMCTKTSRARDYVYDQGEMKKIMSAFRGRDFLPNWFSAKVSFMIPETVDLDGDKI